MKCPRCNYGTKVSDSRRKNGWHLRRRVCLSKQCGFRFSTEECIIVGTKNRGIRNDQVDGDFQTRSFARTARDENLKAGLRKVRDHLQSVAELMGMEA